jgi:hypothetical protein
MLSEEVFMSCFPDQTYGMQVAWLSNAHMHTHAGASTFASWFERSRSRASAQAIRQQATLVVAALAALYLIDSVTNSIWSASNYSVRQPPPAYRVGQCKICRLRMLKIKYQLSLVPLCDDPLESS